MKFFAGLAFGATSVLVFPSSLWADTRPYFSLVRESINQSLDTISFYFPSEMKKRKSAEIIEEKARKNLVKFEVLNETKNQRQSLRFYTDLQEKMKEVQVLANHRALTKKEKAMIINETLKNHYPEIFPDYKELVKSRREKQGNQV